MSHGKEFKEYLSGFSPGIPFKCPLGRWYSNTTANRTLRVKYELKQNPVRITVYPLGQYLTLMEFLHDPTGIF